MWTAIAFAVGALFGVGVTYAGIVLWFAGAFRR